MSKMESSVYTCTDIHAWRVKIEIEINKEAVPVHPFVFYEQNLKERLLVRAEPVQNFLKELAKRESFSIAGFKRTMHSMWKINNADTASTIDYQSPSAMFDNKLFVAGRTNVESNLNTAEMSRLHCTHCGAAPHGETRANCLC